LVGTSFDASVGLFNESPTQICRIFLDLSKAFDTFDLKILLNKMEQSVGIRGTALKLFKSYLSDRYLYPKVKNVTSNLAKIMCGVPQGRV